MTSLPQELVDRISSYLTNGELKHTLTLNKAFNLAAERLSGAFAGVDLSENDLQQFLVVYANSRLRLLREVTFRTYLLPIQEASNDNLACRETPEDLRQKDEHFTSQIRLLFSALETIEQRIGGTRSGRFKIIIHGPTRRIDKEILQVCLHRLRSSWRIRLLATENLPELRCVRSFQLSQGELQSPHYEDTEVSKLDLRMVLQLAKKMPNVEFIGCQLGRDEVCEDYIERSRFWSHYEHDWEGPRRDTRHAFAEDVERFNLPPSLKRARLDFLDDYSQQLRRLNQSDSMPDLVGAQLRDPFSVSLCTLTHNLRVLELKGIIDPGLFQRHDNDLAIWPNLESLVVMFWPVSPSGRWFFHGPNAEGKDAASYSVTEDHYPPLGPDTNDVVHDEYLREKGRRGDDIIGGSGFRITPNNDVMVPFLTAFASAAARMPNLKDANLWCPLIWYHYDDYPDMDWSEYEDLSDTALAWGIAYYKPPVTGPRTLTWRVWTWRPDERLHALFRNIGCEEHGGELEEDWKGNVGRDGLVWRGFFSDYEVMPCP